MTVCVALRVNDCIVFATDSASTLAGIDSAGRPVTINVYNHADKLFNLYKGLPICAMTCGMGNIGTQSISSIAKDIRISLSSGDSKIDPCNYKIEEIVDRSFEVIVNQRYGSLTPKPAGDHSFELYVGGYSSNSEDHELWKFSIVNGTVDPPKECNAAGKSGLVWSGQPEPINRLLFGFSQNLPSVLVKAGMSQPDAQTILGELKKSLSTPLSSDAMPVQDAIDLARFLVDTTKSYYRFHHGADIVGGHTDIAVVTRHEGFKWINRKHYYPVDLNPLETDHVDIPRKNHES